MGTLHTSSNYFDECFVRVGGLDTAPMAEVELRAAGQLIGVLHLTREQASSLRTGLHETLSALESHWTNVVDDQVPPDSATPDPPF